MLGCENKKLVLEMCPSQIKALNFWSIFWKNFDLEEAIQKDLSCLITKEQT